ncbi:hypothetical protein QYM36_012827 [Artemia franciscana]|uniref:Major facilitator superfamily (MFS) profile domain-containing protein n=3 Tax=Artemia franciscana TaxID=6661 RepID=A0AA88HVW2_ARTSF|nr:hypothetical protein QYM36_012827 [Artemia franciscana]
MTPLMVGLFFGLKDGANSVASPIWGYLCDTRGSVRIHIIISSLFAALSLFLIGPFPYLPIEQTLVTVGVALIISGIGFSGQQVAGVVDALRELVFQGFPDSPSTHGLVAGLWTSFSGAGRFISRAGTGILVDHVGFQISAVIMLFAQLFVVAAAVLHSLITSYRANRRPPVPLSLLEAGKPTPPEADFKPPHFHLSIMESGDYGQLSVTVSQPGSPAESLTVKSISIPVPRKTRKHEPRLRSGTVAGYPS